ncbi:MAG: hypothetical protein HKN13_07595 [Rhodothermales bacterium]|nr:hypothetical protein [Rhodothermales bacterium]
MEKQIRARIQRYWLILPLLSVVFVLDVTAQIVGIDHIPIAVRNLDEAVRTYQSLGFAIKEGRPHENGIRNKHIKFPDGTELELISIDSVGDDLAAEYAAFAARGEGPAFVALYASNIDSLSALLADSGIRHLANKRSITFPADHPQRYLFFGPRQKSPTDRSEHFNHSNGAQTVMGVWLAPAMTASLRKIGRAIGVDLSVPGVSPHGVGESRTERLEEGFVRIFSADKQRIPGRPILGVTVRVDNIWNTLRVLQRVIGSVPTVKVAPAGRSLTLKPEQAHGIWLQFLEVNSSATSNPSAKMD